MCLRPALLHSLTMLFLRAKEWELLAWDFSSICYQMCCFFKQPASKSCCTYQGATFNPEKPKRYSKIQSLQSKYLLKSSLLGVTLNSSVFPPFCCPFCCCFSALTFFWEPVASGAALAALHWRVWGPLKSMLVDLAIFLWHNEQLCWAARVLCVLCCPCMLDRLHHEQGFVNNLCSSSDSVRFVSTLRQTLPEYATDCWWGAHDEAKAH